MGHYYYQDKRIRGKWTDIYLEVSPTACSERVHLKGVQWGPGSDLRWVRLGPGSDLRWVRLGNGAWF